jgi:cyd operon protein YbgT
MCGNTIIRRIKPRIAQTICLGAASTGAAPDQNGEINMWYFSWVLGVGFAIELAILNAMWGENEDARKASRPASRAKDADHDER